MRERYSSPPPNLGYQQEESLFGLSDLASLPAFCYFLFFLLVLSVYSANPLEPALFGFYKLSLYLQLLSFFSVFFLPTLLIYFALDLTKSAKHTVIVLAYPLLALGAIFFLQISASPALAALMGLIPFAFYFTLGLSRSAADRRPRTRRPQRVARPASTMYDLRRQTPPQRMGPDRRIATQRQRPVQQPPPPRPQYPPSTRPAEFRRDGRPPYRSSDGFLSKLDRFLDRYDYVDGEAVKKGSRRSAMYERERRRGRG
ncbi:MAG: hypothetical protein ACXV48_05650 [Halobacteriota archaeon]